MIVVSDTSPIRCLLAIGQAGLLKQLFTEVVIPTAVEVELRRVSFLKTDVALFLKNEWVKIATVKHDNEYEEIKLSLDEGESEAIVLAIHLKADLLLMDENKGRTVAKTKGLKSLGLIGVLLRAKKMNYISAVKPMLDELINKHGFWIEKTLYDDVLKSASE